MAKGRRQFREQEVLETLIVHQGETVRCFRCKKPFTAEDVRAKNIQKEHLHERGLEGPDMPMNCRYSHYDPCHKIVTNGTPATSAGSSQHRLAKTRGTRAEKFSVNKRPLDEDRGPKNKFQPRVRDISQE